MAEGKRSRKCLQTNWSVENLDEDDESANMNLFVVNSMEEYTKTNIVDLVNLETAAFLQHPESAVRCPLKLTISAEEGSVISAVSVLSESRIAEVYVGKFEEYAFTTKSVQTSSMEDISVSVLALRLERPATTIHLKLSGLADPLRCMLFAVLICQESFSPPAPVPSGSEPAVISTHLESLVDRKVLAFETRLVRHIDVKLAQCSKVEEIILDRKLNELEVKLMNFVDERLEGIQQRLMEKLDKVLELAAGNSGETSKKHENNIDGGSV